MVLHGNRWKCFQFRENCVVTGCTGKICSTAYPGDYKNFIDFQEITAAFINNELMIELFMELCGSCIKDDHGNV